jgi:hypothetical protein
MISDMGKLALLIAAAAASVFAATPDETAIQNTFVKPWIEALRSRDKGRIERMYHPAVRACMNASTQEFFDNALDHEAQSTAGGAYHITKLAPLQGGFPAFLPEDEFPIPVRATYELQVDVGDVIMIRYLAPANGSWYEVYPCPNEKGMAFYRKQVAEGAEQKKKAAQLLADLKDPLRSELKDLLRQQHKIDAIKRYEASAGVDLTTAVTVIDALQKSGR